MTATHFVYVLQCGDGTLYTGYTTDVQRRLAEHRDDRGAKYTRGRGPLDLVHVERYASRSAAMSREREIKSLRRAEKDRLIDGSAAPEGASPEDTEGDGDAGGSG
ncbi:endonuclease [Halobacteriales archaeon QS_5_70_17]|nr:MAG: endonuclease [Halobacteriales archaeon QS_5_70_17]